MSECFYLCKSEFIKGVLVMKFILFLLLLSSSLFAQQSSIPEVGINDAFEKVYEFKTEPHTNVLFHDDEDLILQYEINTLQKGFIFYNLITKKRTELVIPGFGYRWTNIEKLSNGNFAIVYVSLKSEKADQKRFRVDSSHLAIISKDATLIKSIPLKEVPIGATIATYTQIFPLENGTLALCALNGKDIDENLYDLSVNVYLFDDKGEQTDAIYNLKTLSTEFSIAALEDEKLAIINPNNTLYFYDRREHKMIQIIEGEPKNYVFRFKKAQDGTLLLIPHQRQSDTPIPVNNGEYTLFKPDGTVKAQIQIPGETNYSAVFQLLPGTSNFIGATVITKKNESELNVYILNSEGNLKTIYSKKYSIPEGEFFYPHPEIQISKENVLIGHFNIDGTMELAYLNFAGELKWNRNLKELGILDPSNNLKKIFQTLLLSNGKVFFNALEVSSEDLSEDTVFTNYYLELNSSDGSIARRINYSFNEINPSLKSSGLLESELLGKDTVELMRYKD